jgi:rod shape-determining protein MreB
MLDFIFSLLSFDLGIDLGTANTLVWVKGKGIAISEPSAVARQKKKGGKILAIGMEAKKMVGRTPGEVEVLRPLKEGVIADFDATLAMLDHYIRQVHEVPGFLPKIPKPKVVIGIPTGVTEVERRAVADAALSAGARSCWLVEEPMAAAIGAGLPILDPQGQLIVDIGGGTSEIAVISLGGIVIQRCLRIAGDEMDQAIVNFVRLKHGLYIGLSTAEEVKINIGSATSLKSEKQSVVRGRDMESGLPRSLKLLSSEVREALAPILQQILGGVTEVLEETPPELVGDILRNGIVLCGGGSQLPGIDKIISDEAKMPVWVVEDPQTCVVRGCGKLLDDEKLLEKVRVSGGLK